MRRNGLNYIRLPHGRGSETMLPVIRWRISSHLLTVAAQPASVDDGLNRMRPRSQSRNGCGAVHQSYVARPVESVKQKTMREV